MPAAIPANSIRAQRIPNSTAPGCKIKDAFVDLMRPVARVRNYDQRRNVEHGYSAQFARRLKAISQQPGKAYLAITCPVQKASKVTEISPAMLAASFVVLDKMMAGVDSLERSGGIAISQEDKSLIDHMRQKWEVFLAHYCESLKNGFDAPYMLQAVRGDDLLASDSGELKYVEGNNTTFVKWAKEMMRVMKKVKPDEVKSAHVRHFKGIVNLDEPKFDAFFKAVCEQSNKKNFSAFMNRFASARIVSSGANPIVPPTGSCLEINPSQENKAAGYDDCDIHVVVLLEKDSLTRIKANRLATKYPEKSIIVDAQGVVLGNNIKKYQEGKSALPSGSRIKVQVLGRRSISDAVPTTDPAALNAATPDATSASLDAAQKDEHKEIEMSIGLHSAEQLGKLIPQILTEQLGIFPINNAIKATLLPVAPEHASDGTGMNERFVRSYIDELLRSNQVSLFKNFVSIHRSEVSVDTNGKKRIRIGNHEHSTEGGLPDVNPAEATNDSLNDKRVFSYSASSIKPIGETPDHGQKINFLEYLGKNEHDNHKPNQENLEICLIDQATFDGINEHRGNDLAAYLDRLPIKWSEEKHGDKGLEYFLRGSANHHTGEGRTMYAIYDQKKNVFSYKLHCLDNTIRNLTRRKAEEVIEEERARSRNTTPVDDAAHAAHSDNAAPVRFDLTFRGWGSNTMIDSRNGHKVSGMTGEEWGNVVATLLGNLGANGMMINFIGCRASHTGGTYVDDKNTVSYPFFPSDFSRALENAGYVDAETTIAAPAFEHRSNPPLSVTECLTPSDGSKRNPATSTGASTPTNDKRPRNPYLTDVIVDKEYLKQLDETRGVTSTEGRMGNDYSGTFETALSMLLQDPPQMNGGRVFDNPQDIKNPNDKSAEAGGKFLRFIDVKKDNIDFRVGYVNDEEKSKEIKERPKLTVKHAIKQGTHGLQLFRNRERTGTDNKAHVYRIQAKGGMFYYKPVPDRSQVRDVTEEVRAARLLRQSEQAASEPMVDLRNLSGALVSSFQIQGDSSHGSEGMELSGSGSHERKERTVFGITRKGNSDKERLLPD